LRAPTGGDSLLPHRFAVALASGGLAVVGGGGGLAKSVEVLYIPVLISPSLNKLPAFFAAILGLSHLCFVHAFAGAVRGGERRRRWVRGAGPLPHLADVRLVGGVGLVGRILAGSGVSLEAPDLVGELFCPSLVLFGDGTVFDVISDEAPGRFVYHCLERSGEWFHCNCLGSLLFWLLGCSVFWGGRRCLWLRNPSSSAMRWPVVIFYCLGVHRLYGMSTSFDVLLGGANKNFVSSSGRASASSCFPGALLHFGVAEARRRAAPCAGDEDDREILGWTKM